jgi:hypothetical protein
MKYFVSIITFLFSSVLSQSHLAVPGDSNYDNDTSNYEEALLNEDTSNIYLDLTMDLNNCAVAVSYKYNLSDAVKDTVEIMDNLDWIIEISEADGKAYRDILAKTLQPIASSLHNQSGDALIDFLPEMVLDWFVDTTVVYAVTQGTISKDDALEFIEETCPNQSPIVITKEFGVEDIKEVEVEIIKEVGVIKYVDVDVIEEV